MITRKHAPSWQADSSTTPRFSDKLNIIHIMIIMIMMIIIRINMLIIVIVAIVKLPTVI